MFIKETGERHPGLCKYMSAELVWGGEGDCVFEGETSGPQLTLLVIGSFGQQIHPHVLLFKTVGA